MERQRRRVGEAMCNLHPCMAMLLSSPGPAPFAGICIRQDAPVGEAARLMMRTGAFMLLVVDDEGHPVGMMLREAIGASEGPPASFTARRRAGALWKEE